MWCAKCLDNPLSMGFTVVCYGYRVCDVLLIVAIGWHACCIVVYPDSPMNCSGLPSCFSARQDSDQPPVPLLQ
jgi:hypothetical protein